MSLLGDSLTRRREELKLTQLEVAELVNTTTRAISDYETGKRVPTLKRILELSNAYQVEPEVLFRLARHDVEDGYQRAKYLSTFLVKARHRLGKTQKEIAKELGLSEQVVQKHEVGQRNPSLKAMMKYSRIYHIDIYKLVDLAIKDIKEGETNDANKNS